MSAAGGVVNTPIMALVRGLKAAALNDLYSLGLADFIREPLCVDELRARVEHLLDTRRYHNAQVLGQSELSDGLAAYGTVARDAAKAGQDDLCATILDTRGMEHEAFAIASEAAGRSDGKR